MFTYAHTPQPVCGETLLAAGNLEFLNFYSLVSSFIAYPHCWELEKILQMMIKNLLSRIPTRETGPRRKESGKREKTCKLGNMDQKSCELGNIYLALL